MSEVSYTKFDKYQQAYVLIPLSEAALRYYETKYCTPGTNEIDGRQNGPFGGLTNLICEKLPYRNYTIKRRIPQKKLQLHIPAALRHSKVTFESLLAAGEFLENWFEEQFIAYVDGAVDVGSSESFAVSSFLKKNKLDDDTWEFNAARMLYRRAKGYAK